MDQFWELTKWCFFKFDYMRVDWALAIYSLI